MMNEDIMQNSMEDEDIIIPNSTDDEEGHIDYDTEDDITSMLQGVPTSGLPLRTGAKQITVVGRARSGKSFFISRFVADKSGFVKLLCGNSSDKTACPVYITISDILKEDRYFFHTDFESSSYDENSEEIKEIEATLAQLSESGYSQNDADKLKNILRTIKLIHDIENKNSNLKKSNTYINVYQRPSKFCNELIRRYKLKHISITDTPGVSGNVEVTKLDKADIYFFVLRPDNLEEAETLRTIVNEIKDHVGTSKVAFLYRKEGIFNTIEKYERAKSSISTDMADFNKFFDGLKTNIISTDLDILNPAEHCIMLPTMDNEENTLAEELFLDDMNNKFCEIFATNEDYQRENRFRKALLEHKEEVQEFTLQLLNKIKHHTLFDGNKIFQIEEENEKPHDRVKTTDMCRYRNDLDRAFTREKKALNDAFKDFGPNDKLEEWQTITIQYVYHKLMNSAKKDRGLGYSSHNFEEYPPRTMLVEESIFAKEVFDHMKNRLKDPTSNYGEILKRCGIQSSSWNNVGWYTDPIHLKKLEIIKMCLYDIKVSTREDLVLCRYIGGLRKTAEYEILQLLFPLETKEELMDKLKKLPF